MVSRSRRTVGNSGGRAACLAGVVVCLTAIVPETVRGDTPQWWNDGGVQQRLHLTAIQVAAIDEAFRQSVPARRLFRLHLEDLEGRLASVMEQSTADEMTVLGLIDAVEQARARRNVARSLMLLRIYSILTPRQRALIKTLPNTGRSDLGTPQSAAR
jgi:Spy/CpxP family protein refolding chaperone